MSVTLLDAALRGTVELAAAAMLVLAIAAMLARRAAVAIGLVTAQAACLAIALLAEAWLQAAWPLLAVAAFTLATKAVALPLGLRSIAPGLSDAPARNPIGSASAAVALAGLALVAMPHAAGPAMAVAFAVMLVGGSAVMRRDAGLARPVSARPVSVGPVIGVLVLENGLVLALGVAPGLPGVGLLALATAALPAAFLLLLVRRLLPAQANP